MNTQEISFANGITLAITRTPSYETVVYNAVGYITGEPSNVVATFGYDLSREELIKVIFNISGKDSLFELLVPYIEPYEDEKEYEVGVQYDGTEEVAATRKWLAELEKVRIMSLEDEFRGSFPSSIESEEQPYNPYTSGE
jgi:hypothetical protein